MRLALELPASWSLTEQQGRVTALSPDGGLRIVIEPLVALPDDPRVWMDAALRRDLPADGLLRVLGLEVAVTDRGWPLELVDVELGARAVPHLAAAYRFSEYAGLALVIPSDAGAWAERRALALAVLRTGRPIWHEREGAAGIAELLR